MSPATRVLTLAAIVVVLLWSPRGLHGQQVRRSGGLRAGVWNVDIATPNAMTSTPHVEGYFQRGLDQHLALENSIGFWRADVGDTKAYIVPLLTSLKLYPVTEPSDRVEPFLIGGLGFAFGIDDEAETAVGGGGSTIVTGIGVRGGVGIEMRVLGGFGVAANGKYQWIHFGEEVGTKETFSGVGFEGAITYRFQL